MMHKKINITQNDIVGFAVSNARKGSKKAKILTEATLTSDQPKFYQYTEQIANLFLSQADFFYQRNLSIPYFVTQRFKC